MKICKDFPGADLVIKGLENLQNGKRTAEALLVLIGAPRLEPIYFKIVISSNAKALGITILK